MEVRKVLDTSHSEVKALGEGKFRFIISHEAPDLVGDVVVQRGMKPVSPRIPAQVDHSGQMKDVIGYWSDFELRGDHTLATLNLVKAGVSQMADLVRGLTEAGVRLAASIGFQSKKHEPIARGVKFIESSLHEVSVVVVPCQPLALQVAKKFGVTLPQPAEPPAPVKAAPAPTKPTFNEVVFRAMDTMGHQHFHPEWRLLYRIDKLLRKKK